MRLLLCAWTTSLLAAGCSDQLDSRATAAAPVTPGPLPNAAMMPGGPTLVECSPLPKGQGLPEGPRVTVDTTLIPPTGRTVTLGAGGDLQAAIDAAHPGDVIILAAGAVFT